MRLIQATAAAVARARQEVPRAGLIEPRGGTRNRVVWALVGFARSRRTLPLVSRGVSCAAQPGARNRNCRWPQASRATALTAYRVRSRPRSCRSWPCIPGWRTEAECKTDWNWRGGRMMGLSDPDRSRSVRPLNSDRWLPGAIDMATPITNGCAAKATFERIIDRPLELR